MLWAKVLLIALGCVVLVVGVLALVRVAQRRVGIERYAPEWRLRFTRCGKTRDAGEAGVVRIGAWSWKKFLVGRSSQCQGLRVIAVERKGESPDESGGGAGRERIAKGETV